MALLAEHDQPRREILSAGLSSLFDLSRSTGGPAASTAPIVWKPASAASSQQNLATCEMNPLVPSDRIVSPTSSVTSLQANLCVPGAPPSGSDSMAADSRLLRFKRQRQQKCSTADLFSASVLFPVVQNQHALPAVPSQHEPPGPLFATSTREAPTSMAPDALSQTFSGFGGSLTAVSSRNILSSQGDAIRECSPVSSSQSAVADRSRRQSLKTDRSRRQSLKTDDPVPTPTGPLGSATEPRKIAYIDSPPLDRFKLRRSPLASAARSGANPFAQTILRGVVGASPLHLATFAGVDDTCSDQNVAKSALQTSLEAVCTSSSAALPVSQSPAGSVEGFSAPSSPTRSLLNVHSCSTQLWEPPQQLDPSKLSDSLLPLEASKLPQDKLQPSSARANEPIAEFLATLAVPSRRVISQPSPQKRNLSPSPDQQRAPAITTTLSPGYPAGLQPADITALANAQRQAEANALEREAAELRSERDAFAARVLALERALASSLGDNDADPSARPHTATRRRSQSAMREGSQVTSGHRPPVFAEQKYSHSSDRSSNSPLQEVNCTPYIRFPDRTRDQPVFSETPTASPPYRRQPCFVTPTTDPVSNTTPTTEVRPRRRVPIHFNDRNIRQSVLLESSPSGNSSCAAGQVPQFESTKISKSTRSRRQQLRIHHAKATAVPHADASSTTSYADSVTMRSTNQRAPRRRTRVARQSGSADHMQAMHHSPRRRDIALQRHQVYSDNRSQARSRPTKTDSIWTSYDITNRFVPWHYTSAVSKPVKVTQVWVPDTVRRSDQRLRDSVKEFDPARTKYRFSSPSRTIPQPPPQRTAGIPMAHYSHDIT